MQMRLLHLYIFILSLLVYGCNSPSGNLSIDKITSHQFINPSIDTICTPKENLFLLGGAPADIGFINDNFLLAIGSHLVLYNNNGMQIKEFGRYGSGPGEYIKPSKLYISSKNIYIWCEQSLKLLVYDLNGNYITEHKCIQHAIKNFIVWKDKYVCFLIYGHPENKRIDIYNIKNQKHIRTIKQDDNTDDILAIANLSGGIFAMNDTLYWCNPSSTAIYNLSLNDPKHSTINNFTFIDHDFKINKENTPSKEKINNSPSVAFDYIRNNSRIIQAFNKNDTIILLAETGISEYQNKIIDHKKRKIKYYTLVNNSETINSFTFDYPCNYGFIKGQDKNINILTGYYTEDSLIMSLSKFDII